MNPLLPDEIKGIDISMETRREHLIKFHEIILERYLESMDNEGNALNKMKQFWFYFSYNFNNQERIFKTIKKTKNISEFRANIIIHLSVCYK